jgi:hypothetical protein
MKGPFDSVGTIQRRRKEKSAIKKKELAVKTSNKICAQKDNAPIRSNSIRESSAYGVGSRNEVTDKKAQKSVYRMSERTA